MGTRARINVMDGNQILVSIYRQYDGYPERLGREIANFSKDLAIVNGYSGEGREANGMGCYAAQLIAHLKGGPTPGNVYIRDTSNESHCEEYFYNVSEVGGRIYMTVSPLDDDGRPGRTLYGGLASEYRVAEDA